MFLSHTTHTITELNINVSTIDYEKTSDKIKSALIRLEEMVHEENEFKMTDSEFAFGWHFFVVSISQNLIQKLADQMGEDYTKLPGKGMEKKFLAWLSDRLGPDTPRFKLAIKEDMESSKFGIF